MATSSSKKPVQKVAAGAVGGALSIVIVWLLKQLGVQVPTEVASAFTTVFAFAASYVTPPGSGEVIEG